MVTAPRREAAPDAAVAEALLAALTSAAHLVGRHYAEAAARFDLTPAQAALLHQLDEPRPMRAVSALLGCDPSNVTTMLDRIEHRGLVERVEDPDDRRVRVLVLTRRGRRLREAYDEALLADGGLLSALSADEASELLRALEPLVRATTPCEAP